MDLLKCEVKKKMCPVKFFLLPCAQRNTSKQKSHCKSQTVEKTL